MGRVTLFALAASLLLGCAYSTQVAPSALAVVSKQLPLAYNTRDIDLFDSLLGPITPYRSGVYRLTLSEAETAVGRASWRQIKVGRE